MADAGRADRQPAQPDGPRPVPGSAVPAQARTLQGRPAGLVTRTLADVVDSAVTLAILGLLYLGLAAVRLVRVGRAFTFPAPSTLVVVVAGGIVSVIYLGLTWGTTGRSYGKHLMGLRVLGPLGRLGLPRALVRAVLCVVVPIGLAWVLASRENRSLQDLLLRTSVVYDWLGEDVPPASNRP